jgi:hypothetical protein
MIEFDWFPIMVISEIVMIGIVFPLTMRWIRKRHG